MSRTTEWPLERYISNVQVCRISQWASQTSQPVGLYTTANVQVSLTSQFAYITNPTSEKWQFPLTFLSWWRKCDQFSHSCQHSCSGVQNSVHYIASKFFTPRLARHIVQVSRTTEWPLERYISNLLSVPGPADQVASQLANLTGQPKWLNPASLATLPIRPPRNGSFHTDLPLMIKEMRPIFTLMSTFLFGCAKQCPLYRVQIFHSQTG
jgi:hypothetical protein